MNDYSTDAYGRKSESPWFKLTDWIKNRHKRTMERFFSGYRQTYIDRPDGKGKVFVRIYSGNLYRQELDKKQRIVLRVLYAALFLVAISLFIGALCLPVASNSVGYIMLAVIVSAIYYARLLFALYAYLPAKQDFREYEYWQGAYVLTKTAKVAAYLSLLPILAALVLFMKEPRFFTSYELIRMAMLIAAGLSALTIGLIESTVRYTVILSNETIQNEPI